MNNPLLLTSALAQMKGSSDWNERTGGTLKANLTPFECRAVLDALATAERERDEEQKRAIAARADAINAQRERDEAREKLAQLQEWSDAKTTFADDLLSEVRELKAYRDRMEWLHRGNDRDAEGYEWGVFRVKWDQNGQPSGVLHTLTDLSDLDKAMGASGMPRYYDEVAQLRADLAAAREDACQLAAKFSESEHNVSCLGQAAHEAERTLKNCLAMSPLNPFERGEAINKTLLQLRVAIEIVGKENA